MSESRVLVQDGSCSRAVGGVPANGTRVGCAGSCWQAPAVSRDGGVNWEGEGEKWARPGEPRLLRSVGRINPLEPSVETHRALERALAMDGAELHELVKASGLRGRGGAYFPVGSKWATARATQAERKFLLVNAEEGEPGIYKDRDLLEGDPNRVVVGMLIAAHGIGATDIVLIVNGAARLAQHRISGALARAREEGALRIPVELRLGAGGYVLGEETALINVIHGYRSEPLARPPFPAVSGLWANPTVINNVESLANLPDIVLHGVDWFRSVGSPDNPGTKLVSLAGDVRRPGLYEVPLVGGPSGSILPGALAETPFDVSPLQAIGGILGAGGVVVLNEQRCVVRVVRELVAFNARESCGKCTPCREGTLRMRGLFDDLLAGAASGAFLDTLDYLDDVVDGGSLCGLGQMAPNPVRALLRHFGAEVREHLNRECRAGVCTFATNDVVAIERPMTVASR